MKIKNVAISVKKGDAQVEFGAIAEVMFTTELGILLIRVVMSANIFFKPNLFIFLTGKFIGYVGVEIFIW